MLNSRSLDDLHPLVATKAKRYVRRAAEEGIDLVIVSTLRDREMQDWLYQFGRTRQGPRWSAQHQLGKPVTYNPPGNSWHEYGMAFDAWPMVHCRLITGVDGCDMPIWHKLRAISRESRINLRMWLHLPRHSDRQTEYCHHQYTGGLTIEQVKAGERLPDVTI